ncbi:hypothetical protein LCGC14_2100140, partial [marine sediment metagenome]
MAVHNATCTSIVDLITQLDTYLSTRGWTADHLDVTTTAGTGGEWAMTKANVRFATSWDSANSGINLSIYQYSDQAYVIADRPWGQDHDSGNGFAGTTPDSSIDNSRHVVLHATPLQFWVFDNESGENYAHIVVETSTGTFTHFGFGNLIKKGDWVGGEYCYGQFNNATGITSGIISIDGASFLIDGHVNDGSGITNAELYAATIRAVGLPGQPAGGIWAVSVGGSDGGGTQSDFGLDRQSNDGSSSDTARVMFFDGLRAGPYAATFYRSTGVDIGGEMRMWPIMPRYHNGTTGDSYGPMGTMPDTFGCVIPGGIVTGQIFTDENGVSFYVFPANEVYVSPAGESSGMLGIAYEVALYVDPGLPASVAAPTGWWRSRSASDYTLSGSEITVLADKSANSNDFTVPVGKTGPDLVTINDKTWMDFPVSGARVMSATNSDIDPGAGDFTFVVVYRSVDSTVPPGALFGKIGSGNANYGLFTGVASSRSLYFQMRHNSDTTTQLVTHDDAG